MTNQDQENLKELFERFQSSGEAERSARDIREGEQILADHAAPRPTEQLLADINAQVRSALARRKSNRFKAAFYKAACVAAVLAIAITLSVKLPRQNGNGTKVQTAGLIPAAIWESDDIAADDPDLAILNAEVEELRREALALRLGENDGNGVEVLTELENELIEIDSVFWKG